ncbi:MULTISPECIES: hypothetical protein [unclassified Bradyrhizobium]|uniref:hypothetical protein n=1 Tax=unclassified Bradyrhizobium TaxID=2631580 RepID=UPI0031F60E17
MPDLMLGLGPGDIGCDGPMHSPIKPIALTLFKSGMKEYRALVADVNLMGSLSGWDLARQVREREPTFPVIYMPGAAADHWASQGVPNSILLQKPFAPAQLVTAISQLLNQVPPYARMRPPQLRFTSAFASPIARGCCGDARDLAQPVLSMPQRASNVVGSISCGGHGHSDQPLMIFRRPPSHQWVA